MKPAVLPRALPRDSSYDDDEPTRLYMPPSSVSGVALSAQSPAPILTASTARAPGRLSKLVCGALGLSVALSAGMVAASPRFGLMKSRAERAPAAVLAPVAAAASAAAPVAAPVDVTRAVRTAPATISAKLVTVPAHAAEAATPALDPTFATRADADLDRASLNPLSNGFVILPPSFTSEDGAYDLVVHFHGHTKLVEESFTHAGVNAVLAVVNLGVGSAPYDAQFSSRYALQAVLDRAQATLEKRGLKHAKLRRLALSAFSAGYAAVRGVLNQPALADRVDAVLLEDGIHTGFMPRDHSLDEGRLAPFLQFAEQAAAGKKLFSITHSEITPNADYAGTHVTTDAILAHVGVERVPGGEAPELPALASLVNVAKIVEFAPLSEATKGSLHVRGFAGTEKADHVMHMAEMSVTVLPELVRYWASDKAR